MRGILLKVIGISGSPRKDGNTEILVKYALEPFREQGWEVQEFFLSGKVIKPCRGCETCRATGVCTITDDDMTYIYEEFKTCNAFIIGSPVYYRNITAQLKALFDRSFAFGIKRPLEGKVGGAIAVGRGEGGGQSLVLSIIHIRAFEKLPVTSEMESIGFFDEIPMNVTYDRDNMIEDLKRAEKYSSAYYV
jgi:multimeric flavodoxin WrbA